jgi:GLPGLI family protein
MLLTISFVSLAQERRLIPTLTTNYLTDTDKYELLDTSEYEISYSLRYVADTTLKVMKEPIEDVCILQIGKHASKTYSQTIYDCDSIGQEGLAQHGNGIMSGLKIPVPPVEYIRNGGKMTVTYLPLCTTSKVSVFRYVEDEPIMNWNIGTATKVILGYTCTKATTVFRGREYEAWFTTELPFQVGPWMFGGLPGLIMSIHDTKNHYEFECIGLNSIKKPIKMYQRSYKDESREKISKAIQQMYERSENYVGSVKARVAGTNTYQKILVSLPYNPIELK